MDETLAELGEHIQAALGDTVDSATVAYGELTLEVRASEIVQAVRFLRDDTSCLFVNLTDIVDLEKSGSELKLIRDASSDQIPSDQAPLLGGRTPSFECLSGFYTRIDIDPVGKTAVGAPHPR